MSPTLARPEHSRLRWTVCALLFFATTINYIDRQVLSMLAKTLQDTLHWTENDYGDITAAFAIAYGVGLLGVGRALDKLGTRLGFALAITVWSFAAMGHALVASVFAFSCMRVLLGLGEAANFPACIKTVAEWFPKKERAQATGLFNAGANIGAIFAPVTVPLLAKTWGWQWAFIITGGLGFLWLAFWLKFYYTPSKHPRISASEYALITSDPPDKVHSVPWSHVIFRRETWAFALGKFLSDPVWTFFLFWLPKYLQTTFKLSIDEIIIPMIVVYNASTIGSVGGGWLSSNLIKRGWTINAARKTTMLICALCVVPVFAVPYLTSMWEVVAILGLALAAHQGWSANIFTTVSDMFPRSAVGSVVGIGGAMGALGNALMLKTAGWILTATGSYFRLFMICGSAYLIALAVIHLMAPKLATVDLDSKRTLSALAILLVLTSAFFWKLTLTREWTFLEGPDLAIQVRPWLDYAAREFHQGRFPLWDPYEWAGHTLIGQVQPGIANPLNWILFAMPLRDGHIPITTLHWYWVLIHFLGAAFAYALCRDLGAGFLPAVFGGCVFALTGFLGHTDWPQILMSSIWIPLVLLFFFRVIRDHRPAASAALSGAAMGLAFLGTHHVVPTFTALLLCAMWLALVAMRPRHTGPFVIFLAITAGMAAFQVLPALEYSRLAIRWAGAPDPILPGQHVPFSVHAEYSLKWREVAAMLLPRGATHVNPYVGLTAFVCALLALWRGRNRAALWLAALTCGALAIALASPPYWLLWRFAPMVEKAREPAFAIVIAQVGLASLAALGLSRLPRWAAPLALALFLLEAANHAPHFQRFDRRDSYLQMQRNQLPVIDYLRHQSGWFRVDFDDSEVPYNAGDLYGIEQFGGAVSSMPLRVHRVLGHDETPRTFGIRYRVARTPSHPSQVEVFRAPNGLAVFRDPRGEAEPLWSIPACGAQFHLLSRDPHRVTLDAEMPCAGLAVIGDPYYPGWRAYVDGRRVPLQEVDAVRAVRLTPGHHHIEYLYRPTSVYLGLALTLAAALSTLVLVAQGSRPAPKIVS